ncbi:MAG TPA: MerC domain-containing protein [Acidobacteriota bacterium]|nr:MerC domain-containing protein [Acidobacteriota bacterium]
MVRHFQMILDRLAVSLSVICALHCIVLPFALLLLPLLGSTVAVDDGFHRFMLWLILPSSIIAVSLGCRRHKDIWVFFAGLSGLAVLVLTAFYGHNLFGELGERLVTLFGTLVLFVGHLRNYSICRREDCCHSSDH